MACTGIEFCKLAIVETKARARDLVEELERRFPELDVPITVNVNGCPNACARTQVADIGLKGQLVMHEGEQVGGFQVHLGGATGLQANFGRKLRAHKVTSEGLDDYVTVVVSNYLADRVPEESFATWVARADEELLRGEKTLEASPAMSERAFPVHCPYCGEQDLWPHDESHGSWECRGCLRAFSLKMLGLVRPGAVDARECTVMTAATTRHRPRVARHRDRGPLPRGAARAGLALGRRARAGARPRRSSSGRPPPSATGSASPRRWATRCSRTWPPRWCPGIDVVFLDTGYHFIETIGTRDAVAATLDVNLLTITPVQSVAEQDAAYGKDLYKTDPDLCCALRKVKPLTESLAELRRLGHRAAPGRDPQPGDRPGDRLGRQEGQGQGLPARAMERRAGGALHRRERGARQPVGLRRLPVDRLRSVHPSGRSGRGRPQRPVGRHQQDRVRDPLMSRSS